MFANTGPNIVASFGITGHLPNPPTYGYSSPKTKNELREAGSELLSCRPAPVLVLFTKQRRSTVFLCYKLSQ